MEHLFPHCSKEVFNRETEAAAAADVLEAPDWATYDERCGAFEVPGQTDEHIWLGGYQDDKGPWDPKLHSADVWIRDHWHGRRGWDILKPLKTGKLADASSVLDNVANDGSEAAFFVASYLQHWLYIGLLEALLEKRIDPSYLVKPSRHGYRGRIYSRNLTFALGTWGRKLESFQRTQSYSAHGWSQEHLKQFESIRNMVFIGSAFLMALLEDDFVFERTSDSGQLTLLRPLILQIAPAIFELMMQINTTANLAAQDRVRYTLHNGASYFEIYAERNKRLQTRGWCPSGLLNIQKIHRNDILDYVDAAGLQNKGHEHGYCSSDACVREKIDPATYRPQHRSSNCNCGMITPSLKRVNEILEKSQIPVITLSGQNEMDVKSASDAGAYVAISHVWSDGLGSTTEEGIPSCQALYLSGRVEKLLIDKKGVSTDHDIAFWIDSLCVPAAKNLRNKAIQMMASTYRHAAAVLVLDNSIQSLSLDTRFSELNWNIAASSWMRRLWTYQEARLARKLYFCLADGFREAEELLEPDIRPGEWWPSGHIHIIEQLTACVQTLRMGKFDMNVKRIPFGTVFDTLNLRTTSRPSDETLAVAELVGADVSELLKTPVDSQRICSLAVMAESVPLEIIFIKRPRVDDAPFRWLPRTMLGYDSTAYIEIDKDDQTAAEATRDGLKAKVKLLILHKPVTIQRAEVICKYHLQVDGMPLELREVNKRPRESAVTIEVFDAIFTSQPITSLGTVIDALPAVRVRPGLNEFTCDFASVWRIVHNQYRHDADFVTSTPIEGHWETLDVIIT